MTGRGRPEVRGCEQTPSEAGTRDVNLEGQGENGGARFYSQAMAQHHK